MIRSRRFSGAVFELWARFSRYCVGASISFGANLLFTWFLHAVIGTSPELAFGVSLVTVHLLNFFVGRHYIYRAAAGEPVVQFYRFTASAAGFRAAEYLGFLLVHTLLGTPYLLAAAAVLVVSFVAKFFFYGKRVFIGPMSGPR